MDSLPPQNLDAERSLLGSLVLDGRRCDEVAGMLSPADFYADAHQKLYRAILALHAVGQVDAVLLVDALRRRGEFEAIGGPAYIAEVVHAVPAAAHARYYAGLVKRTAMFRAIIHAAYESLRTAYDANQEPEDILAQAESALAEVRSGSVSDDPIPVEDAVQRALARIEEAQERRGGLGLPTGLASYDVDFGGLFPGELVIVAARTSIGKTAMVSQIAVKTAAAGQLVYFATLEMSAAELTLRNLCADTGVSNVDIRTGHVTPISKALLVEAANRIARGKMVFHDRPRLTIADVARNCRRLRKHGMALIIVDYLQKITPSDRRANRYEQIGQVVRDLKELAGEMQVPVLVPCQLRRDADTEEPRLSHLRESGDIEQEADVVWLLGRKKGGYLGQDKEPFEALLDVAKNRNGTLGKVLLHWDGPRTRFACPLSEMF